MKTFCQLALSFSRPVKVFIFFISIVGCQYSYGDSLYHLFATPFPDQLPDKDNCDFANPCSIHQALSLAEKLRVDADVKVSLFPGVYNIIEPLFIGGINSRGKPNNLLIEPYAPNSVLIVSERVINDFANLEPARPDVLYSKVDNFKSRQLYKNGSRIKIATIPDLEDSALSEKMMLVAGRGFEVDSEVFKYISQLSTRSFSVEIEWFSNWLNKIARVDLNDSNYGCCAIVLKQPEGLNIADLQRGQQKKTYFFLRNHVDFLVDDNRWAFDNRGVFIRDSIRYSSDIYSYPVLESLLVIRGDSPDRLANNITIRGVAFSFTSWSRPNDIGYIAGQGGVFLTPSNELVPGVIKITNASNVNIEGVRISNAGAWGVAMTGFLSHVEINNCVIENTSSGGIYEFSGTPSSGFVSESTKIEGNIIRNTGLDYRDSVAVFLARPANALIKNNRIENAPYTAISIGWSWTDKDYGVRNNAISGNFISGVMRYLSDGGAIYNLGFSGGLLVSDNVVKDIKRSGLAGEFPIASIYLDNGSSGVVVKNNIIDVDVVAFLAVNQPNKNNYFVDNCVSGKIGNIGENFLIESKSRICP